MELNLKGRAALVTGGSQGIGRAIATQLAAEGVTVGIVARDMEMLMQAAVEIGDQTGSRIIALPGDMSSAQQIEQIASKAVEGLGQIDILINNAGSAPAGRLAAMPDETWDEAFALKLMGYMRMTRALVPAMRTRKWGRVVNIIGRQGHQPSADGIIGGPLNASVQNFTVAVAEECAPDKVLINAINPGPIRTARHVRLMNQRAEAGGVSVEEVEARSLASVPLGRFGEPEEIAAVAVFLCSEGAGYITGAMINVDGGGTRRV